MPHVNTQGRAQTGQQGLASRQTPTATGTSNIFVFKEPEKVATNRVAKLVP